jgi:hypothetical protein
MDLNFSPDDYYIINSPMQKTFMALQIFNNALFIPLPCLPVPEGAAYWL